MDKLIKWLSSQRTDASHYLCAHGHASMLSLCTTFSWYCELATVVDDLGLRNMLEGRIPTLFFVEQQLNTS